MDNTGISEVFQLIVTGEDVQKSKPSPEGLTRVLGHFKLEPHEAVYIGDWTSDYEMAKAAGVRFLGVRSDFNLACPDRSLFSLISVTELPAFLRTQANLRINE